MNISLAVDGKDIIKDAGIGFSLDSGLLPAAKTGSYSLTVTDPEQKYFVNGVCKMSGIYMVTCTCQSATVSSTNQVWIKANVDGFVARSFGTSGITPQALVTVPVVCNVGYTLSVLGEVEANSAIQYRVKATVIKVV